MNDVDYTTLITHSDRYKVAAVSEVEGSGINMSVSYKEIFGA